MNYIDGATHIAFISSDNKVFIQSNGECVELLLDFTPQSIYRNYEGAVIILSTDNVLYFVYDGIILDTKIELKTSIVEIYFTYSYFIILDSNNVLSVYCESSKFNEYRETQLYYYNNCSIPLNFSKELLFIGNIAQLKNFDNISVVKYMQGVHCMYTNYLLTIVVFMDSTYIIYRTGFDYYSEKDITFYKNIETKFINMSIADKIKSIKKFMVCMLHIYYMMIF